MICPLYFLEGTISMRWPVEGFSWGQKADDFHQVNGNRWHWFPCRARPAVPADGNGMSDWMEGLG